MKISLITIVSLAAALALAGPAAASSLAATPAAAANPATTTARPLHTGVHRALHHHHRHGARGHVVARATIEPATAAGQLPAAPRPLRHPARSHSALPHSGIKTHPTTSRGGHPYPIGQASPNLGIDTRVAMLHASQNLTVTDPANGILKGRSPPRGDPPSAIPGPQRATSAPLPARLVTPLRARPRRDLHDLARSNPRATVPCSGARLDGAAFPFARRTEPRSVRARARLHVAGASLCSRFVVTPDRAPEGGPVGPTMPSWRFCT